MNLGPLFTLTTFLGATWYFLFKEIRVLTVESPANEVLLPLGFTHSAVVIYLILALVVFCGHSVAFAGRTPAGWTARAQSILFLTWPFSLVSMVLALVLAKLQLTRDVNGFVTILALSCLGYGAYEWAKRDVRSSWKDWFRNSISKEVLIVLVGSGLFSVPYVLVMSMVLSDVRIETDKRFYGPEDKEVIITLRRGGYIACPDIKSIEVGNFRANVSRDGSYSIPLHAIGDTDYIMVDYRPQVIEILRHQFASISIVKQLK